MELNLLNLPKNYTVIDIETTGLSAVSDDIIELSGIKVENDKIVKTFTSLTKPNKELNRFISQLTGISNEMLADAPDIKSTLEKFLKFVGDDIILGHNVTFDKRFICNKSTKHFNKYFDNNHVDTLGISRKLKVNCVNHKLATLADFYKIECGRMHRGLEDCRITYEVYQKLKSDALAI